jgi:hypothetical protein
MKRLLFLPFLLFAGFNSLQAQSIKLPEDCQKILNSKFRKWTFAVISADIKKYYLRVRAFEQPNLIKGDWNNDGKSDYAVLLERKNKFASDANLIVAFLKRGNGYGYFPLEGNDCLMSVKKGSKAYDFEKQKSFRYRTDGIFSYIWEKAGVTYVWENRAFRAIPTSD